MTTRRRFRPVLVVTSLLCLGLASAAAQATVLAPVPPPLDLTASDGSGLELVSVAAKAVIEDPLAFTELHLVFRNPESRVREGRFRITLPSGATISRFAMNVGGRWQEGEVVEQQAARVAYEDFLHRRQDPALLEAEAGNEFSARVFPIPANGTKELIVSYSQELTRSRERYRLPLRGLPRLGSLSVRALVDSSSATTTTSDAASASNLGGRRTRHEVVELRKRDFKPDADFEVTFAGRGARAGLRHENLVVARVVPLADTQRPEPLSSLFVLIDTSASRALGFVEQVAAFEQLMAELGKAGVDPTISVAAFDQEVTPIFTGKGSTMGQTVRKALQQRRALGASDLDRALSWLAAVKKDARARALLISDGVATAGDATADLLRARVRALGPAGIDRLDAFAVGGIRDDALLARLVTAGLAKDGVVLDANQAAASSVRRLLRATRSGVKLDIPGAGWVWPATLNGIQPGDEVLVYADLPRDRQFRLNIDGVPWKTAAALAVVERPLLERSWVRARIARLLQQRDDVTASDRDLAEALRKQVIELSVKSRVLSPFTSLLVLETEQDYARFGIERRALADILTVGVGGIALVHRTDAARPAIGAAQPRQRGESNLPASARPSPMDKATGVGDDGANGQAPPPRPTSLAKRFVAEAEGLFGRSGPQRREKSAATPVPAADERDSRPMEQFSSASPPPPVSPVPATEGQRAGLGGGAVARPGGARSERRRPAPSAGGAHAAPELDVELAVDASRATPAVDGQLAEILLLIQRGRANDALNRALAWRQRDAGHVLALVALGESWEALGEGSQAARAYGSIIDLFPGRADMRRFAGERLERLRGGAPLALAVDTYRKAVAQRPDHPAGHRLLGFVLLKQGLPRQAFEAIAAGLAQRYPSGRFRGVDRILREDLGLAAAAWIRAEPARAGDVRARLASAGGTSEDAPSLRFILNWETDANDVDFHIDDAKGGHAYYGARQLASGGELYDDVTTGYGPECFTVRGPAAARAFPYVLRAHYYSRGPMGYGMGKLQIIEHDGRGHLRFEERPFVIMQDGAYVELGSVSAPTASRPAGQTARNARAAVARD